MFFLYYFFYYYSYLLNLKYFHYSVVLYYFLMVSLDLDFYYANDSETLAVFREESSWHWELEWTEEGIIAREVEDRYLDGQAGAINGLYKKEDIT